MPWTSPRVSRRSDQNKISSEDEILRAAPSVEEEKGSRTDARIVMRKVSLLSHAKMVSEQLTDDEEAPPQRACGQETRRSSDTLSAASNNTLLSAVSKQSLSKSDHLVHSLLATRCIIIDKIRSQGHTMSFEDRRVLEWDLWLVHGILEFGFASADL